MTTSPSGPAALPKIQYFRITRHRRIAWWGSAVACLISLIGIGLCWLNPAIGAPLKPGLDFTGGTRIQLERACAPNCPAITVPQVEERLGDLKLPEEGGAAAPDLRGAPVQVLDQGRSIELRLPSLSAEQGNAVISQLAGSLGPFKDGGTSVDTIGPTLGDQLLRSSLLSLLVSFAAIALYITLRYDRVFAFLAILCLAHDVLITTGLFAWLGLLLGVEVDSLFAVALITVAGYSVNDTVVVFDRIREQKTSLGAFPFSDQVDVAVDATLTRSLYTSLTTLLPLLAILFFGGSSLFWFSVALTAGISVGSWSSIGVAPTLLPLLSGKGFVGSAPEDGSAPAGAA
ncbi:protein translocase subunit SecF [Synechococcus sp. BA-124 BA4]|uniref:protein translocase subunit SecF n=1 Tax=unclassified Synechococcus TaxID=2626047 RepID=UPI0018CEDCA9|nr:MULTISPECIES: protein translocase subunit SecF [unclassified Synechococcus]MEA5399936.1 protein translocase subunit SecF [Synechococcus sp. BA-124 BA4]QPN56134.1 protein translocase subunit SecF [Synechococcus sp. CBW1107]CAK6699160.1 Protein translocase subunit SecF [Synechococcus sp. CBW1107]